MLLPAWCSEDQDHHPWIQVDSRSAVYVAGLITQARGADSHNDKYQRVTRYRVALSDDGYTWNDVTRTDGAPAEVSDKLRWLVLTKYSQNRKHGGVTHNELLCGKKYTRLCFIHFWQGGMDLKLTNLIVWDEMKHVS